MTIRVELPFHLRVLAKVEGEVRLEVGESATQRTVIDALETRFPTLAGTVRDHTTKRRRDFIRFFACERDLSNEPLDAPLPEAVVEGREPYQIVGAMAGG